jgi:secondary thiamine-phosphate synthase enzyme
LLIIIFLQESFSKSRLIRTDKIEVQTQGENDIVNITKPVQEKLKQSKATEGFILLFLQSTTSTLTIMEFEEGLCVDIPNALSKLVPKAAKYEHEKAYHDGNGHSHVRSSIVGVDLALPFKDGNLLLGTWQQVVLIEWDIRARDRTVIIQIVSG